MEYGERELKHGDNGPDVVELQIRLAGFRGTVPDGDFGGGTELQVMSFQRDYMKMGQPSGVADRATLQAIDRFADEHPIDFDKLKCPCKECNGFGNGRHKSVYQPGRPQVEAYHRYEYPGMSRMLLWAVRAASFYMPEHRFIVTSGYRCSVDNAKHNRTSTNHHGKAIDIDVALKPGESKRDDMIRCNAVRGRLVETANAQIGWTASNRKSLEPENIAPTWVHYDVRSYERKYLADDAFCTDLGGLDRRRPVKF